ncbi:hypothetical protein C1645_870372 [Glomus cerebriforme]|uniref:Uncharacterized protein n=1 Tax=Glomus cerebriforme TaxID=658196 RepID=A0A397TN67_9GLOM|nr:hypothetical protein C1645_870372 [Glomus cerebriforme]
MFQINDTNLPNLSKNNLMVNTPALSNLTKNNLVTNPPTNKLSNKHTFFKKEDITIKTINYDSSEHRDHHKNCMIPVHKTFLLYSVIRFLELIFINKRANQIGIVPKELKPSQCISSKNINTLTTSPFLLHSLCKFNQCQIAEIIYRIKIFDKFRLELSKYQAMVNNAPEYDSDILNLQSEQVEHWFKIAFDGYNWWDKKISNNSKKINQYDIKMCNIKLKNILRTRKRMETIKKKKEKFPQTFRFIPYNRPGSK